MDVLLAALDGRRLAIAFAGMPFGLMPAFRGLLVARPTPGRVNAPKVLAKERATLRGQAVVVCIQAISGASAQKMESAMGETKANGPEVPT